MIDPSKLTLSELRQWKAKLEKEILRRTVVTPTQQKRIDLFAKVKKQIYRNYRKVGNYSYALSKTHELLRSYKLPTVKSESRHISLTHLRKQLKKINRGFEIFNSKQKKAIKKATSLAKKELSYEEYEEFEEEIRTKKNELKSNFQWHTQMDIENNKRVKGFIDNHYARIISLVENNTYPEKTPEFKSILEAKGYTFNEKIDYNKIFKKALKQTFIESKYSKYFEGIDKIELLSEFEI